MAPLARGAYLNTLSDDGGAGLGRACPPGCWPGWPPARTRSTRRTCSTSTTTSGRADQATAW